MKKIVLLLCLFLTTNCTRQCSKQQNQEIDQPTQEQLENSQDGTLNQDGFAPDSPSFNENSDSNPPHMPENSFDPNQIPAEPQMDQEPNPYDNQNPPPPVYYDENSDEGYQD